MNVCYLSRNRKNDPVGGSETDVSATATTSREGIGLRGRAVSSSVPRVGPPPGFQRGQLLNYSG